MEQVNWRNVVKLSGAYIAYLIGSGFATGQEVLQFFVSYGMNGLYGALISAVLFCSIGVIVMRKGHELQLERPSLIFRHYCGNYLGRAIEYFTLLFIFSIVVIMIAGSGAIAEEYFGVPSAVGWLGMGVVAMITVLAGLRRLVDIIGAIGPFIVVFTVAVGMYTFFHDFNWTNMSVGTTSAALAVRPVAHWWQAGTLFFCYNMLAGMVFFTELGAQASSRKEAGIAGFCGGFFLMLTVFGMLCGMLANFDAVIGLQVPNLYLGAKISPLVALVFSVIIMLGIYSTTAPMYWLIKNECLKVVSQRWEIVLTVVLVAVFMLGGSFPFGKLVSLIYPFVGYVGFALVLVVFARTLFKNSSDDAQGDVQTVD
ncbi:MAG: hypothetical protein E6413_00330 [Negativicoccus succinicivorans]|nr:hypothetical protein [Negativicoccus succinicivorans]